MPYLNSAAMELPFSEPETSRDAAIRAQHSATTQRLRVLEWLTTRGPRGGTMREAESELRMKRQSLCPRFSELEVRGLIRKTSAKRDGCRVYESLA
jgi:DNA-binding MarR family transcriptional regulator